MKSGSFVRFVTVLSFAFGILAQASDSTAGANQFTLGSTLSNVMNQTYLNYFAVFHGPQVSHYDSPYGVGNKGQISKVNGMYFDSEITAAYLITPSIGVGPVLPFYIVPTLGQGLVMGDAGVKVFDKSIVKADYLNVYANLIVQLPTSDYSSARKMNYAVKTTPNVRYVVPKTNFTVGSWSEAKYYEGVTAGKTFKLYAAPYANYSLTSKLSANLQYEMEADHFVKDVGYMNFTSYQTDLQPGFVYMITPKVLVNPYLQVFTGEKVDSDHMAIGAVISATL